MEYKIATVVVTYNRSKELIRCLERILQQTYKPQIVYIIDNASTDNTFSCLTDKNFIDNKVEGIIFKYIKMEKNSGGAGGFNAGLRIAFDDGYELFWVMDDDGVPSETCLEELTKYAEEYSFISPLVIDDQDNNLLSFGILGEIDKKSVLNKYKDIVVGSANPFNGVLFTREMIDRIGFPKKEMFIWGDEIEYQERALKYEFKVGTVLDAIHYHPKNRIKQYNIFFNKASVNYPDGKLRQYCLFRNYSYVFFNYKSGTERIKWILKYMYFFVFYRKLDIKGLKFFISSTLDGINSNFTKHENYI